MTKKQEFGESLMVEFFGEDKQSSVVGARSVPPNVIPKLRQGNFPINGQACQELM
jgi:hypothetical protein